MRSTWRENCRAYIAEIDKGLPASASLDDRVKALRKAAGGFHCGTSWGKQVWSQERRYYLAQFGYGPHPPLLYAPNILREAHERGDIYFFGREEGKPHEADADQGSDARLLPEQLPHPRRQP